MRIVFINPVSAYIRGGAEVNDLRLGQAFGKLGHDVTHLDVRDPGKPALPYPGACRTDSLEMRYFYDHALKLPGTLGKAARGGFYTWFLHTLLKKKKALLHSADMILITGKPLLADLKKETNADVFLSVRGHNTSRHWPHYSKADCIIYWGGCEDDHPPQIVRATPHLTLNPAVEKALFYPAAPDPALRTELQNGKPSCPVVLYVGRLDPVHQVGAVLRAAAFCRSQGMDLALHIAGDGQQRNKLTRLAHNLALNDAVFHGLLPRKKLGDYYRAADLVVINPRHTNHPIVLKEAVACGTCILAPKLGRVEKILRAGGRGQTFKPNNQNALNMALLNMLRQKSYKTEHPENTTVYLDTWEDNARTLLDWRHARQKKAA